MKVKKIFLLMLALLFVLPVAAACGNQPAAPKVVEMKAYQYGWTPDVITVKQGQTVKLIITSTSEENPAFARHGLALEGYNINQILPVGETTAVEFVADKKGSFRFRCSVPCGSGHMSMIGTLVVE